MLNGLRVLIVEDDAADADLAIRELGAGGIECVPVRVDDGLAALAIAAREAPDVPFIFVSGKGALRLVERLHMRSVERQIRDSEQRLRDIVDTVQDWIWELSADGRFVFSSESVQAILGLSVKEVVGSACSSHVHESDREAFARTLAGLTAEQRTTVGIATRWRHADGTFRWLEGNLVVLTTPDGRVNGFRGTHRDVTERKQQQERITRLTRMLQMQSAVNAAVVRIRDREELLREACRLALQVGGYQRAMVALVAQDGRRAVPWYSAGELPDPNVPGGREFPISDGTEPDTSLIGRSLRTGEITFCADLAQSEPRVAWRDELLSAGYKSVVALPLSVDGARIGVLSFASRESDVLRDEELLLLQDMIAALSFGLQYRQKEHDAQFLAYFDQLTGLAKRALFCERLDAFLKRRDGPEIAPTVVAFDVVHLNKVNDSFGRHVGDLLLQRVADRLKHHIGDDEHVGYVGGGTFVVVLPQVETSAESVTSLLESTVFRDVFDIEGRAIRASFKTGLARFPVDGEDGNTLVQRAEAALKQAKESGEQYLHYQLQMHSDIAERLALEHKLRIALDEKQFVLHYQPQVNIATGRIESVEALLRWNDPQHGIVLPVHFLAVLEASGMIVAVGDWALQRAVEDCQLWRRLRLTPVRVAVNVSAQQIRRRNFVDQFLAAGARCNADGFGLDVELTETGLLHDVDGASRKLRELRSAGMRIAIDDFGTGYSSLGLLSKLPVDLLKIDRSFISGLPDDPASVTLVSSIVGLASAFQLTAVAEGVETLQQFELLRRLRCDHSQGYLHSEPVTAREIEQMLMPRKSGMARQRAT